MLRELSGRIRLAAENLRLRQRLAEFQRPFLFLFQNLDGVSRIQQLTGKIGLSRARVFVSGENLLTGSSLMRLFDPETISGGRSGNAYPLSRTWSFGVSLTF